MERTANGYRLSTGREFSASGGIIGLDPNGNVSEGYDASLPGATADLAASDAEFIAEFVDGDDIWTREERIELAEFMIARWTAFRDRARGLRSSAP